MREALAVIGEDGLENLWERHARLHKELWAGLKEMGPRALRGGPQGAPSHRQLHQGAASELQCSLNTLPCASSEVYVEDPAARASSPSTAPKVRPCGQGVAFGI